MSPPAPYGVLPSDRFTNWRKRFWKAEQAANDRAALNERRRASGTSVVKGKEAEPAPPPSGESDRRALGSARRERVVQLTLEAAEGGDVRPQVVALQKSAPPTKPWSRGGQRGPAGPNRAFFSPCLHCGRQLHLCRKECECGKPNRWHVHRRRVVRLSLTVGGGAASARIYSARAAPTQTPRQRLARLMWRSRRWGRTRMRTRARG